LHLSCKRRLLRVQVVRVVRVVPAGVAAQAVPPADAALIRRLAAALAPEPGLAEPSAAVPLGALEILSVGPVVPGAAQQRRLVPVRLEELLLAEVELPPSRAEALVVRFLLLA
jgi:hypothetical protein